jgi:hypothetical protein
MLSAHDLPLYLLAIKSLLRFYPSVAVVVYSDGSLDEPGQSLLLRHVPGCRVVRTEEADRRAREVIGADTYLAQWRARDASWRRLVDTELWSPAAKRIIMDSDILTLRRPHELIDWIERGDSPVLVGQPPAEAGPPAAPPAGAREHIQTVFKRQVGPLSAALGLPGKFLDGCTSGFYCCRAELDLSTVERLLRAATGLGIPMHEWGGEQCTVIYLLSEAGGRRFDPERYINFDPRCAGKINSVDLAHFYGTYRFYRNNYPALAAGIAQSLTRAPVGAA